MCRFRIFLSYSHEDRPLVENVAHVLEQRGLVPMWDKNIRPGSAFTDAIKGLITHAHIFMPLITPNAKERPWVHQETGYAMALNIPVLPLAVGEFPGEMIAQLQAIKVKPDLSDLDVHLDAVKMEPVVLQSSTRPVAMVEVADWPEKRVELMAQCANRVAEIGGANRLFQRGGLSSFSIPDTDVEDPVWKARDGDHPRSDFYHYWLREERRALERHARQAGCDLLIDPTVETAGMSNTARRIRLDTLREFLCSMADDQMRVICSDRARDANITIVGDWFIAESRFRRPGQGWRQTVFSWHGPTVLRGAREFNQLFDTLLKSSSRLRDRSRAVAIEAVEDVLRHLG
jgi:hypothetical protein